MDKQEFDKLLKIGGFKTKKEFANLLNLNPKSVNNWGVSQNIPYWVKSWLNNYIALQECRELLENCERDSGFYDEPLSDITEKTTNEEIVEEWHKREFEKVWKAIEELQKEKKK